MYQLMINKGGVVQKIGGDLGLLQEALHQLEALKAMFGEGHTSPLEHCAGIKIDDFYVFVLDGTGNYIRSVKFKKEKE